MPTEQAGHEPIEMKRVTGYDDLKDGPVGAFYWSLNEHENGRRYIKMNVPTPHHPDGFKLCSVPVEPGSTYAWEWDGNEDRPTLKPSIDHFGHWHGWVQNGRMVKA